MKFSVDRSLFAAALAACCRIATRNSAIKILSHVLVVAKGGSVHIKATNLDMDVSFSVPAEIETEGSALILAEMLDGFAQRVKTDVVSIAMTDGSTADIRSGRSRLTIPTLDAADFVALEGRAPDVEFTIAGEDLGGALNQCAYAATDDPNTGHVPGIYIHPSRSDEDPALRFAAYVSPGLFVAERALPCGLDGLDEGFILPKGAAIEVARLAVGDVKVSVSRGYARFDFAGCAVIATKLLEGAFPDYRRIFPPQGAIGSVVDRKAFGDALDRVALTSDGRDHCVRIDFSPGVVILEKQSAARGHATEDLACETASAVTFGMQSTFLAKTIKAFDCEKIAIVCVDAGKPVMIRPAGRSNPTCMIAPITVAPR